MSKSFHSISFRSIALGVLALLPTLALLPSLAQADDTLTIESVDGDRAVIIFDGNDQKPRNAHKGDKIKYWDSIQTSRLSAARIRYPDDSVVQIGRDTKFTVQPKQGGTQYNQLDWGQVRAQVEKGKSADPKAPPRFTIRTRTATMGVRGTDFVAGYDAFSGQSSLHTIEGAVDISTDESKVMAWKGTPVSAGHEASLGASSLQPALGEFAPQAYKDKIKTDQPELVALADRPSDGSEREPASMQEKPDTSAMPASTAPAAEMRRSLNEPHSSNLNLIRFRVGGVSVLQNAGQGTGIQYTTVAPSWNPSYRISGPLSVVGHAGGFLVKNGGTGSSVPIVMGGGFLDYQAYGPFHIEGGGGLQTFKTDTLGAFSLPYAMGNVVWDFAPGKWLDQIYAGYSVNPTKLTDQGMPSEAFAGIGVKF